MILVANLSGRNGGKRTDSGGRQEVSYLGLEMGQM